MDKAEEKFVKGLVLNIMALCVFFGLLMGGWKDISVFWEPQLLLFYAQAVMALPQLRIVTIRVRNEGKSSPQILDYAFRLGYYFSLMMFLVTSYIGEYDLLKLVISGVFFGGLVAFFMSRRKDGSEPLEKTELLDLSEPASHATYTRVLYYGLPFAALCMFFYGPGVFDNNWVLWMGTIIICANIFPYYPYKIDWKNAPWNSALALSPMVIGMLLIIIANRLAG